MINYPMAGAWTEERKQKARERILKNKPWEKSTGPRTVEGKRASCLNALKHGNRSELLLSRIRHILMLNEITVDMQVNAIMFCEQNALTNEVIKKLNKNKEVETPPPV